MKIMATENIKYQVSVLNSSTTLADHFEDPNPDLWTN